MLSKLNQITFTPLLDTLQLVKITDAEYFSNQYSNYISNSRLSLINPYSNGSPEKFFQGLNQNGIYSDSIRLGSIVHGCALQPEAFTICDSVELPTAKLGFVCEYLYDAKLEYPSNEDIEQASNHINYYKGKLTEKRIEEIKNKYHDFWLQRVDFEKSYTDTKEVLYGSTKLRETAQKCLEALSLNSYIQQLLHPIDLTGNPIISKNEWAILLDIQVNVSNIEPFILSIKAKLDNFTVDTLNNEICINDIKTLGKVVSEFSTNFNNYYYYRELTEYSWLLNLCAKKFFNLNKPTISANCLVVSTIPNYYTKVYKVTKSDFIKGWNEFVFLLKLVAYYYSKGYRFT